MFLEKHRGKELQSLGAHDVGGGDEPFRMFFWEDFLAQKLTQFLVGFGKDDRPKWLTEIEPLTWVHCGKVTMGWDGKLLQRPSWILKMFDIFLQKNHWAWTPCSEMRYIWSCHLRVPSIAPLEHSKKSLNQNPSWLFDRRDYVTTQLSIWSCSWKKSCTTWDVKIL